MSANKPTVSAREKVQQKLVEFLSSNLNKFNAPYGVIEGLQPFGKGKVRTITFGVARYLDATIMIYQENNISINGSGALASKYAGHFKSAEEVVERLKS